MGSVIGIPVTVLSIIAENGIFYCLNYCISYVYLGVTRYLRGKRLNNYDFSADGHPEKIGFITPEFEWELEPPQSKALLGKVSDDAFCFGANSGGESLFVHISRRPNNEVRCSLLLKLGSGRKFYLPEEHLIQRESQEPNTFGSSRLKLQCLQPMRKWRIFFNGTLKEELSPSEHSYKHVKFTFIWTASAEVFDFGNDLPEDVLARTAAANSFFASVAHLRKISDLLNNYEQPGMLLGTYTAEGEPEKELYLWGIRGRYMGKIRELTKGDFLQIYGQFQSGATIHLEILNIPGIATKLVHGFVMHSNGFIDAIKEAKEEEVSGIENERDFKLVCGKRRYNLIAKNIKLENGCYQKEYGGRASLKSSKMLLNHIEGKGFILEGLIQGSPYSSLLKAKIARNTQYAFSGEQHPLIVSFKTPECQNHDLTGGKGSSLGKLYSLSKEIIKEGKASNNLFYVPKGIVVTTEAYKLFTKGKLGALLQDFEKTVWNNPKDDVTTLCEKTMKAIKEAQFPNKLADAIDKNLGKVFGDSIRNTKFAVRSSATGEDTEQMSAAGQMETFLGLRGLNQIIDAVKNCWASQFSFQAVEYKRRYGQLLNTPMAVVIQQMVSCDVAGVLFTCDPVTGDPSFISITGNWGLGETVVSASAEPDTITLKRDIKNNLKPHSYQIGHKQKKIIMEGESGTKEVDVGTESNELCIDEEMSLRLGEIALKVEEHYGAPRDIEWGFVDEKFYLFQARPVTSIDVDTDFEIKHIIDNFVRMEKEYRTTANIGEVMPGALSPLGIDIVTKTINTAYARQGLFRTDGFCTPDVPYFQRVCSYACNHGFINFIDGIFRFGAEDPRWVKSMMIAFLGRLVDNSEMSKISGERFAHEEFGLLYGLGLKLKLLKLMYYEGRLMKNKTRKFDKIQFPSMEGLPANEILRQIGLHFHHLMDAGNVHFYASFATSSWNLELLTLLAKAEDDFDTDVYSDFAYLLSTCSDVESADVPAAIQNLGKTISKCVDTEKFKNLSAEDALNYIKNSPTAGEHFNKFIEKHGHRCLKEFDVQSKPWDSKPGMLKLIKMLQGYVSSDIKDIVKKDANSFSAILSNMHVNLDLFSKLKLRFMLPYCRQAVSGREASKSIWIKCTNKLRKTIQALARQMVREGYLPDEELIYYLCIDEIHQLIKTRSPRLLTRAIRRQRVHPELEKLVFPEISIGVAKPINADNEIIELEEGFAMQGIPVSQGAVKGTARVITDFEEVTSIKKDDILITYSTDIGWSPYFPLLSGVVTELGGLISHGAVVAREYGLPCVVGLHGATKVFKSGDTVYLDGNKGILKKIEDE